MVSSLASTLLRILRPGRYVPYRKNGRKVVCRVQKRKTTKKGKKKTGVRPTTFAKAVWFKQDPGGTAYHPNVRKGYVVLENNTNGKKKAWYIGTNTNLKKIRDYIKGLVSRGLARINELSLNAWSDEMTMRILKLTEGIEL